MNKKIQILFLMIITIPILYVIIFNTLLRDVFNSIFIAFIIAYSLRPIQNKFIEKGFSRKLSALFLIIIFIAFFAIIILILIPKILKEMVNLGSSLDTIGQTIEYLYNKAESLHKNKFVGNILEGLWIKSGAILKNTVNSKFDSIIRKKEELLSLAVLPVMIYYFLADGESISKTLVNIIPVKRRNILKNFTKDINIVLSKYIISQFLLSALISVLTFGVLYSLGVSYPVLLSILNGVFNIIPYFGPAFGAIPAVVVALLKSTKTAIWTAVLLYIIQQVEGDIISPKITGDSVNMHPLWIILILIIGGKIGGFIGMVIAVPVAVAIKVIIQDLDYYMY